MQHLDHTPWVTQGIAVRLIFSGVKMTISPLKPAIAHSQPTGSWVGGAAMWPGVGLFIGRAGDNQEHHHWAHQLVIGLEGDVELSAGAMSRRAPALFVPAGFSSFVQCIGYGRVDTGRSLH